MPDDVRTVLRKMGLRGLAAAHVVVLKDLPGQNASWLLHPHGHEPVVLRRYNPSATAADVAYEHEVLRFLSARGWTVPEPLSGLAEIGHRLHCLTRYVPGAARRPETPADQAQRGRDLARLDLALRPLSRDLGQRPRWRPQHTAVTVHDFVDWPGGLDGLRAVDVNLAERAEAAAVATTATLAALGAADLPVTLVHGDFTEWNVHYGRGRRGGGRGGGGGGGGWIDHQWPRGRSPRRRATPWLARLSCEVL